MTEHVRKNYRNHRKATWGFAIALMVAIAAVVIPIASGASDKTYTMLFPSTGAVTPTPPVSGNTTSQTLCSSSTYTVKVAITNTAKSSQLGSADVTFPGNVTLSGAALPPGRRAWQISRSGNVVSLRQLSLPKNGVVTITADLGTGGAATFRTADHGPRQAVERLQRLRLEPGRERVPEPDVPDDPASGLHRDHHRPRVPRPRPERRVRGQPLVADERHREAGVDASHCSARRVRPPIPLSTPTRRTRTACTRSKARSAATSGCASLHPRLTARAVGVSAP